MKGFLPVIVVASSEASGLQKGSASYYCDGVADEVQINLALDAADLIDGALVMLTPGHFYLEDTLLIGDNTILQGCGPSTILEFAATVGDKIMITNNSGWSFEARHATGNFNITLRDMLLNGDKDARSTGTDVINTVHFNTTENLLIENLSIIDGWTGAIRTEFCTYVTIRNNYIINSGDDGIEINEETFFANCYGNTIIDAGQGKTYGSPNGIEIQDGSHDVSCQDNTIIHPLHAGIEVSSHSGHVGCYNVSIIANSLNDCLWGIYLLGLTGSYASKITSQANKLYNDHDATAYPYYAKYTQDVIFASNIINSLDAGGFLSTANLRHIIESNSFSCLTAAGNTKKGFLFDGTLTDIKFTNNIIKGFNWKGLEILGTVTRMHVLDNHILECTYSTIGTAVWWGVNTSSLCRLDRNHLQGKHWSYDTSITTYDVLETDWTEAWNEKEII
jgi:hypothetical protein